MFTTRLEESYMTTFAPQNPYPESQRNVFERKTAPSITGNKGPLRFEEGVATDTDVPNDFGKGAYADTSSAPGRPNQNNPEMFYKHAADTMRERAHVGSASWIEAPEVLGDFVQGTVAGSHAPSFEYAYNSGMPEKRPSRVRVSG
jgi:hypothetical protein